MQEVEQTCEVTRDVQVRLAQKLANREPDRIVVNDDCYYDIPSVTLYEQAVFVRVRATGTTRQLQFKFDEAGSDKCHMVCTERVFDLTLGKLPEAAQILFQQFLPTWLALRAGQKRARRISYRSWSVFTIHGISISWVL